MGEVTNSMLQAVPIEHYIILCSLLFSLGVLGVLIRKNAIIILGCVELMLNSVNLLLAAFSAYKGDGHAQVLVFFIMVVAAAEVAVGLAILTMMYRNTRSVDQLLLVDRSLRRQNDIKKVLAYSTVSQLGFMFIALGAGSYTTAMFHLMTHAFFKALLFLGSGSVIHAMSGEQDMRHMGGLRKKIPVTYWTFLIGTLAITGFPFLSGMISKDEILVTAFAKNPVVWFLLLLNTYVNKKKMATDSKYVGWERLSAQKLKIDEIYNAMIVKPIEGMGKAASMFDKAVLDRIVNFVANGAEILESSKRLQKWKCQTVKYKNTFYGLILLMQFGLIGVFTSLDGLMFYAFWEVTLIPIWFICGLWGQEDQKLRFTTKFFVYTFIGSLFMLGGLIYVYNHSASFALLDIIRCKITSIPVPYMADPDTILTLLPKGQMLLSGIMLKNGQSRSFKISSRLHQELFLDFRSEFCIKHWHYRYLFTVHLIAIQVILLLQSYSERTLHYKKVLKGAVIQAFAHGINIVGLFYCADILYRRFKTRDIRQMGGLAKVAPKFAVLFLIIVFGSMAVPLTNGFIGEFILLKSISDYNTTAVIISGLTVILCAVYMLRMYGKAMFGKGDEVLLANMKDVSGVEFSVLASLVVFVILFGIFPNSILEMVHSSLEFIFKSMNN
ncbi:hypothetical protein FQR65_LT18988 [Abscondita terminalis]|nr:hypothetical protein FQR65_LT18988 [Abscondita terminalis]